MKQNQPPAADAAAAIQPDAPAVDGRRLRVAVSGAVAWRDVEAIRRELSALPAGSIIIHGDSPGCDELAGAIAAELGLTVVALAKSRADGERHPGAAWKGLNERIAAGADLALIFHPAVDASKGARHLLELAQAAGVPVRVIDGR